MSPCVLHEDLPHQVRGDAEKVGSILPSNCRLVDELQIDLIDQGGAGQRVVRTLAPQGAPGDSPEFTVNNGKEFRERLLTSVAPVDKQLGDLVRRSRIDESRTGHVSDASHRRRRRRPTAAPTDSITVRDHHPLWLFSHRLRPAGREKFDPQHGAAAQLMMGPILCCTCL